MIGTTPFRTSLLLAFSLICGGWAQAEVAVSVTITGDLDEIIPILELLRDMGIGHDALGEPGDPLRLNIHSFSNTGTDEPDFEAVAPAPVELEGESAGAPSPEEPSLALRDLQFTPSPAKAGQDVLISVRTVDPKQQIDTVVATLLGGSFDLYDNGQHGDAQADDQVWAGNSRLPEGTRLGEHAVTVTAYDPHGDPIKVTAETGEEMPLTIEGQLTVAP